MCATGLELCFLHSGKKKSITVCRIENISEIRIFIEKERSPSPKSATVCYHFFFLPIKTVQRQKLPPVNKDLTIMVIPLNFGLVFQVIIYHLMHPHNLTCVSYLT